MCNTCQDIPMTNTKNQHACIPFSGYWTYDIFPIHSLLHFEYKIIQGSLTFHALTRNQVIENTLCKHLIDRVLQYCTFTSSILNFIQKQFSNSYLILRTFLPRSFLKWYWKSRFRSFFKERPFAILSLAHDNVSAFKIYVMKLMLLEEIQVLAMMTERNRQAPCSHSCQVMTQEKRHSLSVDFARILRRPSSFNWSSPWWVTHVRFTLLSIIS